MIRAALQLLALIHRNEDFYPGQLIYREQGIRAIKTSFTRPAIRREPKMPLPRHEGMITIILEQFRKRDDSIIQVSLVPRLALLIGFDILRHSTQAGYICWSGVRQPDLFRDW